ncbi:MAG: hypothetical protein N3G76_00270 [Candidatus Micrarchaeota archaeon]|nr:hypothetical protein [Candidatus Micrarchaeota archaeon]
MSSESGVYKEAPKEEKKKSEAFKEREIISESKKEHAYKAHARQLSNKEIFSMLSGFKKKWVKGLLGALKKLLG